MFKKEEYIKKYGKESYEKILESGRRWRANNKDKVKALNDKYYAEHKEEEKARRKEYYTNNPETHKKYYEKNKERFSENRKAFRKNHPTYDRDYARERYHMFAFVIKEELELIENYKQALADDFVGWNIHHRKETDEGMSMQSLIDNNLYYNRPASELIFLTASEHTKIHHTPKNKKTTN